MNKTEFDEVLENVRKWNNERKQADEKEERLKKQGKKEYTDYIRQGNNVIELAPVSYGRFKAKQMVRTVEANPTLDSGAAAVIMVPPIGTVGMVTKGEGGNIPKGCVCVRFSSKRLGYEDFFYSTIFCREEALEVVE